MFDHLPLNERKNPNCRISIDADRKIVVNLLDSQVGKFDKSVVAGRRKLGVPESAQQKHIAEARFHVGEHEIDLQRRCSLLRGLSVTGELLVTTSPQTSQHPFIQDRLVAVPG